MKEQFKPITAEQPTMIVLSIIALYVIVTGFIVYLYILHRITLTPTIISIIVFTIIYLPRFLIIKKLQTKDNIKILDNSIVINDNQIPFSSIKDFKTEDKKPQVLFFLNNKMIIFHESIFHLRLTNGQVSFNVIGSEKIKLLKEFLNNILY